MKTTNPCHWRAYCFCHCPELAVFKSIFSRVETRNEYDGAAERLHLIGAAYRYRAAGFWLPSKYGYGYHEDLYNPS